MAASVAGCGSLIPPAWGHAPTAPDGDLLFRPDSTNQEAATSLPRHEIGVVASRLIEILEDDPSPYSVYYRYRIGGRTHLRSGLGGEYTSRGSERLDVNGRLGIDRVFLQDDRWTFYTGLDVVAGTERRDNNTRRRNFVGFTPLLGASFAVARYFSVSTEPRILFSWAVSRRPAETERWTEIRLRGIGQIRLNIRF